MAAVAKSGKPSLATVNPSNENRITGLKAGEAIEAGDLCLIHTDGTVMLSNGASNNAAAKVRGVADKDTQVGEAITLYKNVKFGYGAGLTPGTDFYLSASVEGGLDTDPPFEGAPAVGFAVDTTRIDFNAGYTVVVIEEGA